MKMNDACHKKGVLQLQRGLPGSGKSFRAQKALDKAKQQNESCVICSADNWFFDKEGIYKFDGRKLSEAHNACLKLVIDAIDDGIQLIIVDNTNIKFREFSVYVKLARISGYKLIIDQVEPTLDDNELEMWCSRCLHCVSLDTIKKMRDRWEPIPTGLNVTYV
jgi:hypothetical protein